jgi:hypothetical protein
LISLDVDFRRREAYPGGTNISLTNYPGLHFTIKSPDKQTPRFQTGLRDAISFPRLMLYKTLVSQQQCTRRRSFTLSLLWRGYLLLVSIAKCYLGEGTGVKPALKGKAAVWRSVLRGHRVCRFAKVKPRRTLLGMPDWAAFPPITRLGTLIEGRYCLTLR